MSRIVQFDKLAVGAGQPPRVVGAISAVATYTSPAACAALPLDVAEFRLDTTGFVTGWRDCAAALRAVGKPVLLTLRHRSERGAWNDSETARLAAYERSLPDVSVVDTEIRGEIVRSLVRIAHAAGKPVIGSFHDFEGLPPLDTLRSIMAQGFEFGVDIVKLAVRTDTPEALDMLEALLAEAASPGPLCIVGMGPHGPESRVRLALAGSCLTYGYADEANVPGQLSSAELIARLRPADLR